MVVLNVAKMAFVGNGSISSGGLGINSISFRCGNDGFGMLIEAFGEKFAGCRNGKNKDADKGCQMSPISMYNLEVTVFTVNLLGKGNIYIHHHY